MNGTNSWNFEWNTNIVENGEYTIKVRSYDGTKYSEEVSITVTVDNNEEDGDDGGGGFLPGFGAVAMVGGIGITMILYTRNGKKEMY